MQYAATQFHDELPAGTRVYPFAYWQGLPPEQAARFLGGEAGIHANLAETSGVLAIDPALCDMEQVRDFEPEIGELRTSVATVLEPVFFATPGSFWRVVAPGGGVWGRPSESTPEQGEEFLDLCRAAVVDVVHDMDRMHELVERA